MSTSGFGLARVRVAILTTVGALAGCGGIGDESVGVRRAALCESVTLTPSVASPQAAGTGVTWTASASCSSGTPQYRFWLRTPTGGWSVVQDWSATATYAWSTTGLGGTYAFDVDTRASTSAMYDSSSPQQAFIVGAGSDPCTAASLSTSPTSPQTVGAAVTVQAASTCPTGETAEYRYWMLSPSSGWSVVQDWSTSATYAWATTSLAAGTYQFDLDVRHQGSAGYDVSSSVLAFVLASNGSSPCTAATIGASPSSPQAAGTAVTISATSTCPSGETPEYRFWFFNGSAWSIAQNWSTTAAYAWSTTGLGATTDAFDVDVRHQGGAAWEASSPTLAYTLTGATITPCTAVAIAISPASPQYPGAAVTVTATPTCPTGETPEYRYWIDDPVQGWRVAQDWSTTSTYAWPTTGKTSTTYTFDIDVRHQGASTWEASSPTASYVLDRTLTPCTSVALSASPSSPSTVGTAVTFSALASCPYSTAEYRYWVTPPNGSPALAQDWGTLQQYAWTTTSLAAGTYGVTVDARHVNGTAVDVTSPSLPYTLGAGSAAWTSLYRDDTVNFMWAWTDGAGDVYVMSTGGLYHSTNNGGSWTIDTTIKGATGQIWGSSKNDIYYTLGPEVLHSANDGASWQHFEGAETAVWGIGTSDLFLAEPGYSSFPQQVSHETNPPIGAWDGTTVSLAGTLSIFAGTTSEVIALDNSDYGKGGLIYYSVDKKTWNPSAWSSSWSVLPSGYNTANGCAAWSPTAGLFYIAAKIVFAAWDTTFSSGTHLPLATSAQEFYAIWGPDSTQYWASGTFATHGIAPISHCTSGGCVVETADTGTGAYRFPMTQINAITGGGGSVFAVGNGAILRRNY